MKKAILFIFVAILLSLSFTSCSDDPRVAPTKVYIINVAGAENTDFMNGIRVIYVAPGDTVQLDAITNRVQNLGNISWHSEIPGYVSVDQSGLATGNNVGASLIYVQTPNGNRVSAAIVSVVVDDEADDIQVIISEEGLENGSVSLVNGSYVVRAHNEAELANAEHRIAITYVRDPNLIYSDQYVWRIGGDVISGQTTDTLSYNFADFGNDIEISCTATVLNNFGEFWYESVHAVEFDVVPW